MKKQLHQWLFRLERDEKLPIVLGQRRIFIIPTKAGLLFALVLLVMLIGAINYNLGLGHALVFLLAGLAVVAMVHTFRNLIALRLTPGRVEPVFAGETAHFVMFFENTRKEERRALEISFAGQDTTSFDIAACDNTTVTIPYQTENRGMQDPGRLTLRTRFPLGLFHAWSYPYPKLFCLVYPKPLPTPLPASTPAALQGQSSGDSGRDDFVGLRQWQTGDPIRHIAWKAVARDSENKTLLVKQFGGTTTNELWLDWALFKNEDTETRLSILTAWVLAAEGQRQRYGVRLPNREISPNQGEQHRAACLEALALYGEKN